METTDAVDAIKELAALSYSEVESTVRSLTDEERMHLALTIERFEDALLRTRTERGAF